MTRDELNSMTVLQLRKLAKENMIVLGTGIDKAGIIEKLAGVICNDTEAEAEGDRQSEPKYQAAWRNSDSPKFNVRPAYQAPPAAGQRPAWMNTTPSGQHLSNEQQHVQPMRPGSFTPRFGPAVSVAPPAAPAPEKEASPERKGRRSCIRMRLMLVHKRLRHIRHFHR